MPRVSVFDGYCRTADDQAEGALFYVEVVERDRQLIDIGATVSIDYDNQTIGIDEESVSLYLHLLDTPSEDANLYD